MSSSRVRMPRARVLVDPNDITSARPVNAAVLKEKIINGEISQDKVYDDDEYICRYCTVKVKPVAIGDRSRKTGKKLSNKPHFALVRNGKKHDKNPRCPYDREPLPSFDKPSDPSTSRPPINEHPDQLDLDWIDIDTTKTPRGPSVGMSGGLTDTGAPVIDIDSEKNYAVDSLEPLVECFISNFGQGLNLSIPGIEITGYDNIFERVSFPETHPLNKLRIYFGLVIYTEIEPEPDGFIFHLTDGKYNPDNSRPRKKSEIHISLKGWSPKEKEEFRDKVHGFQLESRNSEKEEVSLIFFLGNSETTNNSQFSLLVDDCRLIDLRVTDKLNDLVPTDSYQDLQEPERLPETSKIPDEPEDREHQENEDPETSQEHPHEDEESQEGAITGVSQPDSDSDLPVEFLPSSGIPPNDLPQPATETPGVPEGEVSEQDEVADVTHEKSLFKKLQSPLIFLAVLIGLIVVAKNVIVEENIRDSQPTEEVQ